jgi:TonB-linked SusC/RagA family outer membrane protein
MKTKIIQILTFGFILCSGLLFAQQTVTGTITDEKGVPLPGATVAVKGTSNATTSDFDGNYAIQAANGEVLVVSFVGYTAQEFMVSSSTADVNLSLSTELDEVVVTAFGINRSKNEVTYQTQKVGGEMISSNSFTSAASALTGKVAGLQINTTSNGVNPSSKIILRGLRSISASNDPLIVIDGAIATKGAFDDLNPVDIASIDVLKGATAASLYGSDASNGALIIETKKGALNSKFTVGVQSVYTIEEVSYLPDWQTEYGTGWDGDYMAIENTNFGPRFDGTMRRIGPVFPDGTYQAVPYAPVKNHILDFFETGESFQNTVYITGGDATSSIYLSASKQSTSGIVEMDRFNKTSFKFNASKKIGNLKVGFNGNFLRDKTDVVGDDIGDQDRTFYWFVFNTPANVPLSQYRDWENDLYSSPDGYFNAFYQNPYWAIDTNRDIRNSDRINGNSFVEWQPLEWLTLEARIGVNKFNSQGKYWRAEQDYDPVTQPYHSFVSSFVTDSESQTTIYTSNFLAKIEYDLSEDIILKSLVGASFYSYDGRSSSIRANNLSIPDFYDISNGTGELQGSVSEARKRSYGYFLDANFGYQDRLFLNLSGRYDYTSVLPEGENGYFYPSFGVSAILVNSYGNSLLDSFDTSLLNYAKLTFSNATVYNDAVGISAINERYFQSSSFPFGSINGFYLGGTSVDSSISKEKLNTSEIGLNLGLLDNKITLDASYYMTNTTDLLTYVTSAPSSGASSILTNVGDLEGTGFELSLNAELLKINNFTWDFNVNYSTSETIVKKLAGDSKNVLVGGRVYAALNKPFPQLRTTSYVRDPQGRVVIDPADGNPIIGELKDHGTTLPKHIWGFNSSMTLNGFTLSATLDYRTGHKYYAQLADAMEFTGSSIESVSSNRQDFVFPNSVVETSPGVYVENTNIPITNGNMKYWQNHHNEIEENYVRDASSVKLREVALRYDIPSEAIQSIGLSKLTIGFVGRNLLTWLPEENRFSDPEFNNSLGNAIGEGGYFQSPPTRNYGLSVNLEF